VVAFFGLLTALVVARFAPKPGAATSARAIAAKPWTPVAGAPMAGPTSTPATVSARDEAVEAEHPTVAAPPPAITPGPNDLIFRDPDEERRVLVGLEELRATVHEVEAFSRRRGTEVAAPLGEGPKQAETGS